MKRIIEIFKFLNRFDEDFFIILGLYFIAKAGFMIYIPLGYLVLGVFFMSLGMTMLQRR